MKICFILNSITDVHALKRVNDFKTAGADVEVYGFLRKDEMPTGNDINVIGKFSNSLSYAKRIKTYYKGISKVFAKERSRDTVWYYINLDVALVAVAIDRCKRKYIYEECDLVHTRIKNKMMFNIFEAIDKRIIKKSYRTILTSEAFAEFHYGVNCVKKHGNIMFVKNKLDESILQCERLEKEVPDSNHLKFSFAGGIRYATLLNIADVITRNFPQHEFHFYGFVSPLFDTNKLPRRSNIFYHGRYTSPNDLPKIYQQTDVMAVTYDLSYLNVKYAEPNKLYEAIYFRCPMLVTSGTYLAKEVNKLKIGYDVNPMDEKNIIATVHNIEKSIVSKISQINKIDKNTAINNNDYAKTILASLNKQA